MIAGDLYDPLDPELVAARLRARQLCRDFNASAHEATEERRRLLLQLLGTGGETAWIEPPFACDYGANIRLGNNVYLNFACVVLDVCPVIIGDFVKVGPAVQIYTASHPLEAAARRGDEFGRPITIGEDAWIGGGAIVCPGVTIGPRTVVGAGSVVVRDIPADVFAAGNPCRVVRAIAEES
jgi:maltose O-acetyltransferase